MIELTERQARALLYSARYPASAMLGEDVSEALAHLSRSLAEIEGSPETADDAPKTLAEQFAEGWAAGVARARAAASPDPKWEYVARAVVAIQRTLDQDPLAVAQTDRLAAYVRDTFDALGLSIRDERTLYVVLTTAGLLVEMASNGHRRGQTDRATVYAIAAISQTLTAALIPYLPDEAKT